jgi:hypothetical protein
VNGTFTELVYSAPINVYTYKVVEKTHVDPDIEIIAQKRAAQMLKNRREAFGEDYEIKSNKIHFIAENEMQLQALKSHVVFKNPLTIAVIGTGAKFIPALGTNKWEGHLGLKQQTCTLLHRMIWGYWRHINKEERESKIQALETLGLKPCFPKFRPVKNIDQVRDTADLIGKIGGFPDRQFITWAEDVYTAAKITCTKNQKKGSKAHKVALMERNLKSQEMRDAFQLLRSYKHEIGIGIADKNLGPTVYSQDLYDRLQYKYLTESGVYTKLGECNNNNKLKFELMNKQRELIKSAFNLIHPTLQNTQEVTWLVRQMKMGMNEATQLSGFYLIIKVHKMINGKIPTRPIQPSISTVTEHIARWLHSIIQQDVFTHVNVIRNTEAWIKATQDLRIIGKKPTLIIMDVEALYPSIDIEEGLTAFEWFLNTHCTSIHKGMLQFILELARIVLKENYIEAWPCGIYQQTAGTAMGSAFAVVYAIIFMIWYETPIIEQFKEHITLYGRYIDDGQTIWTGTDEALPRFLHTLQTTNKNIKWEIKVCNEASEFLDVQTNICQVQDTEGRDTWGFTHKIFRKELNAYAYLPLHSYHGSHIPKAWIKAELFRFETLCTFKHDFESAKEFFFARLTERGYNLKFLKNIAQEFTWDLIKQEKQRPRTLKRKAEEAINANGCIFTVTRCPYVQELVRELNIQPHKIESELLKSIYPEKVMVVLKNALSMRALLPKCRKKQKCMLK